MCQCWCWCWNLYQGLPWSNIKVQEHADPFCQPSQHQTICLVQPSLWRNSKYSSHFHFLVLPALRPFYHPSSLSHWPFCQPSLTWKDRHRWWMIQKPNWWLHLLNCGAALAMIWSGSPGRRRPWVTVMYGRREITWGEQQSKLECFFVDFNLFDTSTLSGPMVYMGWLPLE